MTENNYGLKGTSGWRMGFMGYWQVETLYEKPALPAKANKTNQFRLRWSDEVCA